MKQVSHFIGLSGIGGVQRNFVEYLADIESNHSQFKHRVYTMGKVDGEYRITIDILNIKKLRNLCLLIKDLISKKTIVHFYNNLSSTKVAFLLFFIPVCKLIIHERGTAWNQSVKKGLITRFNARKASVILSNSKATKTILVKKFLIPEDKITVIYNGVDIDKCVIQNKLKLGNDTFKLGFLGRLDSPKGVHVLIEAMQYLKEYKVKLFIAGDGPLFDVLKEQSKNYTNIVFIGRVKDPYDFLKQIDLLVVPSIREPFGNICIEAGLCKTPVLASNIDGIPEIIKHNFSGELITPTDNLTIRSAHNMAPIPEYVVNPQTQGLQVPMQLNSFKLANKIIELSKDVKRLNRYSLELHNIIISKFSIGRYSSNLELIYRELHNCKKPDN